MAFWTETAAEPVRQHRFLIQTGVEGGIWWWTKTIAKPTATVSVLESQLGNHKFKYPGILTWGSISIEIVDIESKAKKLYDYLVNGGYVPRPEVPYVDGMSKVLIRDNLTSDANFQIQQINADGAIIEQWTLINPFVSEINFGSLDYSSDELVTISMTIEMDRVDFESFDPGEVVAFI